MRQIRLIRLQGYEEVGETRRMWQHKISKGTGCLAARARDRKAIHLPGLQLHDCRIDAEIFLMERFFIADPFPPDAAASRRALSPDKSRNTPRLNEQ